MKKCPAVKQLDRFEHQLYYRKGINAGSDDDDDAEETLDDVSSERVYSVKVSVKFLNSKGSWFKNDQFY